MATQPEEGEEIGPAAPGPPPPRPAFSFAVTILCSIIIALFAGRILLYSSETRVESLDRPDQDLEQLVSREMDVRQALQTAPAWERALDRFLDGNEDPLDLSIRWYDELSREIESPEVQLYRVILLAEAGKADRVYAVIVPWQYQGEVMLRMFEWVQAGYLGPPPKRSKGERLLAEIREELSPGWFADTLVAHIAGGIGEKKVQIEAESEISRRGKVLLNRRRVLTGIEFGLLFLGSGLLGWMLWSNAGSALGPASLPPLWNFRDGYALFIRGVLGFLVISGFASYLVPEPTPLTAVITLLAGAPLLLLTYRYLAGRGLAMTQALGLQVPPDWRRLATTSLVLVGLSILGEFMIAAIVSIFHLKTDWTDGLLEDLLWSPWWAVLGTATDSVLWAPLVEEIAFRGVLYGTLRTRMSMAPAALISAGTFAAVHGYGLVGLSSVFWSGIIWAAAYERTRSLWPAMVAHGVNNLMVTTEFVWLFR